ncbi:MAG: acylphosphatase [Dehalococcoidia bacterium]
MKRLQAIVSGRVQGVGFREFVRHEAVTRGICGYVRNSDDGRRVEVVAEGDDTAIEDLVRILHRGPRFAVVDGVDAEFSEASLGFAKFSVEL